MILTAELLTHYIVVRRDLPFGTILAQVTHAAGESFAAYAFRSSSEKERPASVGRSVVQVHPAEPTYPGEPRAVAGVNPASGTISHTVAVVLGARSEGKLLRLERQLVSAGVPHVAIREPDAPWRGALMAIGLEPGDRAALSPFIDEFSMFTALEAA